MRRLIAGLLLLGLSSIAAAQSRLLPGQYLFVGSVSSHLLETAQEGRKICNRFNTHCFGYGHPVTPWFPVLWRASDNAVLWCHTNYSTTSTYGAISVDYVAIKDQSRPILASAPTNSFTEYIHTVQVGLTPGSFRWMELDDSGNLNLYESVIAFKVFPSLTLSESSPTYRGFMYVGWQVYGVGSHNGTHVLEQIWDGPLVLRTAAGQTLSTVASPAARYMMAGLDGQLWTFDRDDVPVWEYLPSPLVRPAYWRVTDDGNLHLIQGRQVSRISGTGSPPAQCNQAPSLPSNPAPLPGGGTTTPTPSSTKMTRLLVPGASPPSTVPAPVNHSSPW